MIMTLQEIAQEMLKDVNRYAKVQEVDIPQLVQARTHKKTRVNKKWKKRYGMKIVYKKQKAKVADITVNDVINFCIENNLPMPDEFRQQNN
jgi:hypothetical protein